MDNFNIYDEWEEQLLIYNGILFNNQIFENDFSDTLSYDFACAEYKILEERYHISKLAGKGSEFERAARLTSYFAPKLTHKGDYDNHIECNALSLLDYSLNCPEHGINCVSKAKILQECCLSLGIYARRIWLMPYSPYDYDCHVVNEIFDCTLRKWIMLDMTADGYFLDEDRMPLSVLEMRDKFAHNKSCIFVHCDGNIESPFASYKEEQMYYKKYFAKNLFYLKANKENCFGDKGIYLTFLPKHFNNTAREQMNKSFCSGSTFNKTLDDYRRGNGCNIRCLTSQPI